MTEVLRTDRLALRPVTMGDHRALLAHWTGPLVRRHLFGDRMVSAVQVAEIIATSQRDFAVEGYGLWALRPLPGPIPGPIPAPVPALARVPAPRNALAGGLVPMQGPAPALDRMPPVASGAAAAESAPLIGVAGLRGPADGGVDVEILYSLEPDRWGQGLAAEASRAVLGYAFEVVGLRRITAEVDAGSASSAAVAEQLGMRPWRGGPDGPDGASYYAAERTHWLGSSRAIDAVP